MSIRFSHSSKISHLVATLWVGTRFVLSIEPYFSAKVGYHPETALGPGNYRLFAFTTSDKSSNHAGTKDDERLQGVGISLDQEFGETFGGFVRAVWANADTNADVDRLLSFGANIRGNLWGRPQDNAAFVMDRFMRAIGLPGKAFVPLIVGFGCNVPAIMATRILERQCDRILTIVMAPFMPCGARLPVYALFAAAFFPVGG